MNIQNIRLEGVNQVYSGINGRCCCGCSGKHYEEPGAMRTKVVRTIQANEAKAVVDVYGQTDSDGVVGNVSVVVGKRLYVAYLTEIPA